ncbi:MAG: Spy/CpxP family protein refolding chaperone [Candidatus Magnetobacterium sp. LHC-1]|nr:Spy/CpxP family protein refolding chaperone [Nitrospirota bacterium]
MLVRRTLRTIVVAMVLTLAVSTTLMAEVGGGLKGSGGGDAQHIILRALVGVNLTDAQKTAIAGILKGYKDALQKDIKEVVDARTQLLDAIHADSYDEAKVRAQSRLLASKEEELAVLRAKIVSEVNAVLTTEQKAILEQAKEDFAAMIKAKIERILNLINTWIGKHS